MVLFTNNKNDDLLLQQNLMGYRNNPLKKTYLDRRLPGFVGFFFLEGVHKGPACGPWLVIRIVHMTSYYTPFFQFVFYLLLLALKLVRKFNHSPSN